MLGIAVAAVMLFPSHVAPEPPPENECDRLSACVIIDCDAGEFCLIPGLPLPELPLLP